MKQEHKEKLINTAIECIQVLMIGLVFLLIALSITFVVWLTSSIIIN